ncbi:hypothetical protein J6590_015186 [Homalodisca vitripennis]|nr:hypothetical protein J6590_015186 [Homalodisca vitripennis]
MVGRNLTTDSLSPRLYPPPPPPPPCSDVHIPFPLIVRRTLLLKVPDYDRLLLFWAEKAPHRDMGDGEANILVPCGNASHPHIGTAPAQPCVRTSEVKQIITRVTANQLLYYIYMKVCTEVIRNKVKRSTFGDLGLKPTKHPRRSSVSPSGVIKSASCDDNSRQASPARENTVST